MGKQTPTSTELTDGITLWASNYKRTGYGFAGWNTKYDYTGTNYGPNQTITAPADVETNGLSLYAMWIPSKGTLQNWNGCNSMNIGDVTALTDNRDNDTYAVAKLADGKCWTIENLRLDDSAELSSTNTHNPSLPLNNSWYYENQQGTLTTSNHLSATTDPTTTTWCTGGIDGSSADCYDQSMLATSNTTLFTNNIASSYSTDGSVYSYGNYYNWYSATAGHGKYGSSYGNGYIVPGDICPSGWHLPTGRNSASIDFASLDVAIGGTGAAYQGTAEASNRWRSYPNNFIYSGFVDGSSFIRNRNSYGYYWSSSPYNGVMAYHLDVNIGSIFPGTDVNSMSSGRMVRCIADT